MKNEKPILSETVNKAINKTLGLTKVSVKLINYILLPNCGMWEIRRIEIAYVGEKKTCRQKYDGGANLGG